MASLPSRQQGVQGGVVEVGSYMLEWGEGGKSCRGFPSLFLQILYLFFLFSLGQQESPPSLLPQQQQQIFLDSHGVGMPATRCTAGEEAELGHRDGWLGIQGQAKNKNHN